MVNDLRKHCTGCSRTLPLEAFGRNRRLPGGRQYQCKDCLRRYTVRWYHARKAEDSAWYEAFLAEAKRRKLARTLRHYDVSRETYDALYRAGCGICGDPPNGRSRYAFDHDHETGKFRGLLCSRCNLGIGNFLDDPARLRRAADYLENPRE
jgi:hypothetical protein